MKLDAVFEGGGIKAIAFTGAIAALEEEGYQFNKVAGASAGALVAALLAVGYKGEELKDILKNTNFKKLLENKKRMFENIKNIYSLVKYKGIYETSEIEKWLAELLKKKGKEKFKDVSFKGKSSLKVIVSDVTKRSIVIFPEDAVNYGKDPMEMKIVDAVVMSIAIPFFFRPHIIRSPEEKSILVDGGVLSNFPVWIFDADGKPRWPTFGFRLLENNKNHGFMEKSNLVEYALEIGNAILDRNEKVYLRDKDSIRTIDIPTLGVKTTEFNISSEKAEELYKSGYTSVKQFLGNWDFQKYIQKYRG